VWERPGENPAFLVFAAEFEEEEEEDEDEDGGCDPFVSDNSVRFRLILPAFYAEAR
jgi:hypothetical protein